MKRKLSDLFELGGTEENDGRTVYYNPSNGQTYTGETIHMFQVFVSSGASVLGVYVLDRVLKVRGFLPLIVGGLVILLLTVLMYKTRKNKMVDLKVFEVTDSYLKRQRKYTLRVIFSFLFFLVLTVVCMLAYLHFSGFVFYIISMALLQVCFLMMGLHQGRRHKILKELEKQMIKGTTPS